MTDTQPMTTADIAAMSDDELNRAIAEARGWYIEQTTNSGGYKEHRLFTQNGEYMSWAFTENDAWDCFDDGDGWSQDANAALELLREMNSGLDEFMLYPLPEGWNIYRTNYGSWTTNRKMMLPSNTEEAPRAICEAWLLWKNSQKDK